MPGKFSQPERSSGSAARIRKDAKGQFPPNRHGAKNSGLVSADPVVLSGDGDATFDTDPPKKEGPKRRNPA